MLRNVALVRTDVSEERSAFTIMVTRIGIVFLRSVLRLLVTSDVPSSPTRHPDDGGATFLKSHTAQHPRRRNSSRRMNIYRTKVESKGF
jgi:hypothetical protein